jgi:hypothetical protein
MHYAFVVDGRIFAWMFMNIVCCISACMKRNMLYFYICGIMNMLYSCLHDFCARSEDTFLRQLKGHSRQSSAPAHRILAPKLCASSQDTRAKTLRQLTGHSRQSSAPAHRILAPKLCARSKDTRAKTLRQLKGHLRQSSAPDRYEEHGTQLIRENIQINDKCM